MNTKMKQNQLFERKMLIKTNGVKCALEKYEGNADIHDRQNI